MDNPIALTAQFAYRRDTEESGRMKAAASEMERTEARRDPWFDLAFVVYPAQGVVLASSEARDVGCGRCGCSTEIPIVPVDGDLRTGRVYLFGFPSTPMAPES